MKEKPLDPETEHMFESMFDPDAAMEKIKNDPMFQKQMKQASPLPLKLVDEFFKLFITAFVKVGSITVIAAIIFRSIYDSDITLTSIGDCLAMMTVFILPRIFYMLVSMGIFWVVIQTVNYLIQFGIVKIYDLQLKKSLKLHKAYVDMIDKRILESPYSSKISRMGITPFEKIKVIMLTHHFFIFPSKEKAEGHSNSLNEAMSQGLIPIVSDYHFNRSIVGDDRLVVNDYNAQMYADKICEILLEGKMDQLSMQMWNRVRLNYASGKVLDNIKKEIVSL